MKAGTGAKGKATRRARHDEPLADWCQAAIPGVCTGRPAERHHIRRRSQGGTDDPSNTVDLCWPDHHAAIHANPDWAYRHGWLVRTGVDPCPPVSCPLSCEEDHR